MNLLQKFQSHWEKQFLQLNTNNCELLLAVSGGVDSVVLVDVIHKAGFAYTIAHCNFQLRREESMRDEDFVKSLGDVYGKEVIVKRFDTALYATNEKMSIQEAARKLRYDWFTEIIRVKKNGWLLTAHHADDNIETVLMHFFRGTGINGLTGIQPLTKERSLIRPLLVFRKKELLAYAAEHGLRFVEDSSNASDKYTRNFFRNQLLPQIKEVFPQAEENLLKNIDRLQEVNDLYKQSVDSHLSSLLEKKGNEYQVAILKWKKTKPLHTITWELISRFGFQPAQTEEIIKLLDSENGAYQSSPTHRIIRNRNWLIVAEKASSNAEHILIEESDQQVVYENGTVAFSYPGKNTISDKTNIASLDASEIRFPLLLRKWKTGDYFYPLGMQKKKKLNRFFSDLKLSRTDKEKIWVIESDQKILWVIGYRIDNRFRVSQKTKKILEITCAGNSLLLP